LIALRNRWLSCEIASPIYKNWDGDIHNGAKTGAYTGLAIGSSPALKVVAYRVKHRPALTLIRKRIGEHFSRFLHSQQLEPIERMD
jgi:hypothetical protein